MPLLNLVSAMPNCYSGARMGWTLSLLFLSFDKLISQTFTVILVAINRSDEKHQTGREIDAVETRNPICDGKKSMVGGNGFSGNGFIGSPWFECGGL